MNCEESQTQSAVYPLKVQKPVGKRIASLYKKRLANFFTEGQWEKVNLLS